VGDEQSLAPWLFLGLALSQWRHMAIDDHPLTVFNKQLENDELAQPVGIGVITQAAKVTGAISQIPHLSPVGLVAKGLDLVGKCLTLGVPTVEENLKLFAKLTEDALLQVEDKLDLLEANPEHLRRFVESEEFLKYLAAGVLQTQRTTQENRLKRMAWIIANGVKEDDLDPEGADDMMRAAAELKEVDIGLLQAICSSWVLRSIEERESGFTFDEITAMWKQLKQDRASVNLSCMGTLTRLQAHGLIHSFYGGGYGGATQYNLLKEGKDFSERLQEIAA
jgi:hypothetical protein